MRDERGGRFVEDHGCLGDRQSRLIGMLPVVRADQIQRRRCVDRRPENDIVQRIRRSAEGHYVDRPAVGKFAYERCDGAKAGRHVMDQALYMQAYSGGGLVTKAESNKLHLFSPHAACAASGKFEFEMRPRRTVERDLHVNEATTISATKVSQGEPPLVVILTAHGACRVEARRKRTEPRQQVLAGRTQRLAAMAARDLASIEVGAQHIAVAVRAAATQDKASTVTRGRRLPDPHVPNLVSTRGRLANVDRAVGQHYDTIDFACRAG